ncbi:MAG: Xaa-Pro peptidase family protein [Hyphomicrobiales bacterium]|nr:Xaa-Pro peptidase family protein [Hyphomicrobiales bacterium]OQW83183.1 MAG: Xaa-Pro dipeptidase [Proteobacteria bacterium ST_bin15]
MSSRPRNIHFSVQEFADRQAITRSQLAARGLDGLLMFRQESMYYLTGYDTFGYVFFQCLVLTADGRTVLLTRSADRLQAKFTSVIDDVRIWTDGPQASPAVELRDILVELGLRNARLGVEFDAYGLTALNGQKLVAALDGFAALVDASDIVTRQRAVKSPAELVYVRQAAALADAALEAANRLALPGAFEGDILAEMQSAVFRGGGDDPANEYIIGSGPGALMCRYFSGRRHLDTNDQLTLEFAGAYRHYHAALMRTILIGTPSPRLVEMHKAARDALLACEARLTPGTPFGDVFDTHAAVLDGAGHRAHRLNACGYSLGTTFAPNWMDWPMFYHDNPALIEPGMVVFLHMILFDEEAGMAMCLARTSEITANGATPLSRLPLDLVINH